MNTKIYLFEYYENTADEWHAEFQEYMAETKEQAMSELYSDFPHARIINSYISTRSLETTP